MHCSKCGEQIANDSNFCPECGAQLGAGPSSRQTQREQGTADGTRDQTRGSDYVYPRNPPLSPHMALLCLVFAGLGQIIFGQVAKGLVLIGVFVLSTSVNGFAPIVILVAAVVDGYMVGIALKTGNPVKKWEFFPRPGERIIQ